MLKLLVVASLITIAAPAVAQNDPPSAAAQAAGTESEFAAFDADKSGKLDQAEFSSWYRAKAEQQLGDAGKDTSSEELDGQVAIAFERADADRDQVVTMQELERFLVG